MIGRRAIAILFALAMLMAAGAPTLADGNIPEPEANPLIYVS